MQVRSWRLCAGMGLAERWLSARVAHWAELDKNLLAINKASDH